MQTDNAPARTEELRRTSRPAPSRIGLLRVLLLVEAAAGVALTVALSLVAAGISELSPDDIGADAGVRFVASAVFIGAILAAIAARGTRRRRRWSWTLAALLQLALGIGTVIAVLAADWHPAYFAGFVFAAVVMLVLSMAPVRRALGQD